LSRRRPRVRVPSAPLSKSSESQGNPGNTGVEDERVLSLPEDKTPLNSVDLRSLSDSSGVTKPVPTLDVIRGGGDAVEQLTQAIGAAARAGDLATVSALSEALTAVLTAKATANKVQAG